MKKVMIVSMSIAVLLFFAISSMVYAGQFGPPEPEAKKGKVSLSVGYSYNSAKLKPESAGNEGFFKERKANQNQAYIQFGYGIMKNWETYLRIGGADMNVKGIIDDPRLTNVGPVDLKNNLKPFGTLGIKGIIYENANKSFGIGPFIQASLYSSYKDEWNFSKLGWTDSGYARANWKNPWDISLGISAQAKIGEVVIYGGPVAYWNGAKAELQVKNITQGKSGNYSTTYKEKGNVGGFVGLELPLGKGFSVGVEGQMRSEFSFGGALTYSF